MFRIRFILYASLGVLIAAGCNQAPGTAPSEEQVQTRVLPPLSAFTILPRPAGSHGNDDDDHDDDDHDNWNATMTTACSPLHRDKEHKDIGPSGGTLEIGPHALVVPAGALKQKTKIEAEIVEGSVNSIRFKPEGLKFETPVYLFMSYANCDKSLFDRADILYTSDDLAAILELMPSFDDVPTNSVVALLTHFSRYAIAY